MRRVLDFQRILAAFGADHAGAAEIFGNGRGIQRGRHHDQAQIPPARSLQTAQQRQRQIALEVPLVEFVEHHAADALQIGIREQAAREHAFGKESQARVRAGDLFEAHLVADRVTQRLAPLRRHVSRRQTGRHTARLEHQHLAIVERQQRGWNARGFPRARVRLRAPGCSLTQVFDNPGNQRIDGQAHALLVRRTQASQCSQYGVALLIGWIGGERQPQFSPGLIPVAAFHEGKRQVAMVRCHLRRRSHRLADGRICPPRDILRVVKHNSWASSARSMPRTDLSLTVRALRRSAAASDGSTPNNDGTSAVSPFFTRTPARPTEIRSSSGPARSWAFRAAAMAASACPKNCSTPLMRR